MPNAKRTSWVLTAERRLAPLLTRRFYLVVACLLFGYWAASFERQGILEGVPKNLPGDEPDYDCIACQLRGTGSYSVDYADAAFLEPYERGGSLERTPGYSNNVSGPRPGLTTYRPPLLPYVLALTYSGDVQNRQFKLMRLLNLLAAAATAGILGWCVRVSVGAIASLTALALVCHLGGLQKFAALLLTESLCGLFVTAVWAVMVRLTPRRPVASGALAGLIWSVGMLTRSSLVLWVPAVALGLLLIARTRSPDRPRASWGRAASAAGCYTAVVGLVFLPWGVRNCAVLGAFMPLGCQGYVELPSGFSDAALRNKGVWAPLPATMAAWPAATVPDRERDMAERGRAAAVGWIRDHPGELLGLTVSKVWSEWKPRSTTMAFVLFAAAVGLGVSRGTPFGWACLAVLAGDAVMIGMTWSVEGRFTYPAVAAHYGLAGAGCWALLRLVTDLRDPVRVVVAAGALARSASEGRSGPG